MPVDSLKSVRLSERVCEVLKKIILEENIKAGDKFYSENQLVQKLQVSRSSIREAVRILEATGWVRVEHGKGIFIANHPYQGFDAFREWLRTNGKDILEHFEVRLLIDPKAASYAALRATPEDIVILDEICQKFCQQADTATAEEMIKLDEQFHAAIAKSTKNRTLAVLMKTMTKVLPEGWISSLHIPGRIKKTIDEHKRIFDAIKAREPRLAEQAMVDHLTRALEEIKASMEAE